MSMSDRMKRLMAAAILGMFAPLIMAAILLQRSARRRLAHLLGRFLRIATPVAHKVSDERDQWKREITWDEVADWIFQTRR